MSNAYYALIDSYGKQDAAVTFCVGLAVLIMLGWAAVRKFENPLLEKIYFGQWTIVYAGLFYILTFG